MRVNSAGMGAGTVMKVQRGPHGIPGANVTFDQQSRDLTQGSAPHWVPLTSLKREQAKTAEPAKLPGPSKAAVRSVTSHGHLRTVPPQSLGSIPKPVPVPEGIKPGAKVFIDTGSAKGGIGRIEAVGPPAVSHGQVHLTVMGKGYNYGFGDIRTKPANAGEAKRMQQSDAADRSKAESAAQAQRERAVGESNARGQDRMTARHNAQVAHMAEATGIVFPHPQDISPNSRDASQAADHFRAGDLPAAADALDRAAASDGNKARVAKISKMAAKLRATTVKPTLPALARVNGTQKRDGSFTALDHNGTEHKISLKDGQITVSNAQGTLTAPAGKDPTGTARRLAGQLAGTSLARTWDDVARVVDLAARTAPERTTPMTVTAAKPQVRAGTGSTPAKAVGARRANSVAPASPPPRPVLARFHAPDPDAAAGRQVMRRLAEGIQRDHPELAVHDHVRDAARTLESGNEEAAQRHLRAAMFCLTPHSLMRNGVHDDMGHISARQAVHGVHRHLLLVKDIADVAAKNQAAIRRDSYGDYESGPSLPSFPGARRPERGIRAGCAGAEAHAAAAGREPGTERPRPDKQRGETLTWQIRLGRSRGI